VVLLLAIVFETQKKGNEPVQIPAGGEKERMKGDDSERWRAR
jgi:hypothetical protein